MAKAQYLGAYITNSLGITNPKKHFRMQPRINAFFIVLSLFFHSSHSATFTVTNNCRQTIWPGTLAGSGIPPLPTTGFRLDSGQSVRIPSTPGWSGRIWARTGCTFDASGVGTCLTGDCGGRLECDGSGASPPASLFEITLGKGNDKDFYDVSIVDGYNLPLAAVPQGVYGSCNATGCTTDINIGCPKELQVIGGGAEQGGVVACKSACEAFGTDQYCCSGQFANPTTCQPSIYSTIFKRACPRAYSYAFDDGTSTFTCKASNYVIVFCPDPNGVNKTDVAVPPPTSVNPPRGLTPPEIENPNRGLPPPAVDDPTRGLPPPAIDDPTREMPAPIVADPTRGFPPPAIDDPTRGLPPPAIADPTRGLQPPAVADPTRGLPPPATVDPRWGLLPPVIDNPTRGLPAPAIDDPTRGLPAPAIDAPTRGLPPPGIVDPMRGLPPPVIDDPTRGRAVVQMMSTSSMLLPSTMLMQLLILTFLILNSSAYSAV